MNIIKYLKEQIEWAKEFFEEAKKGKPSHKNLISVSVIAVFLAAFIKQTWLSTSGIPDIPAGWQMVILVILGIRTAQAAFEKFVKTKNGQNPNQK